MVSKKKKKMILFTENYTYQEFLLFDNIKRGEIL